jgi:eukaryotic-like serine/threonine-protein kinase
VPDREGLALGTTQTAEIASVVFLDIVGYSKLGIEGQASVIEQLRVTVQRSGAYLAAKQRGNLLPLPTGDGMALVFFESPLTAVDCASEIAKGLKEFPALKLRTGIHTGPVSRMTAVNNEMNVVGGGINFAQRVMDAGDAGHILVSKAIADILLDMDVWRGHVRDWGDHKVKHGVVIRLYSVTGTGFGNFSKPTKLKGTGFPKIPAELSLCVALAISGAAYIYFHRPPKLTDRDTVVLADFTNTTGDSVFDGTLRQGLAFQLEQSPFLKIMDDEQVQQDLRLMSLPVGAHISNQIAHDVCVRDAAAATIDGSIASLGKSYVITIQATTCQGGATLAREQIQADDKEHVLKAVGIAGTDMRAKLGESRSSIQKLNRPLEQATTGSLEALQKYTAGKATLTQGQFLAARPLFERAIALDPNFAMAHFYLSVAFGNTGELGREAQEKRKALTLIDRVSEYERDYIAAGYYESTGELDKAIDAYRAGIENYPRVWTFHNVLSEDYINLGRYEEGLSEGQAAVQLQPSAEAPYRRLLDAYMCLDRLDEAKKVAETVRKLAIGARIHQRFLEIAYIEGDREAVSREMLWFASKPVEYLSLGLQAAHLNVLGQRAESSKLYKRAAETTLRRGLTDVGAGFEEADARADALSGKCSTARQLGRPALALAMCGNAPQAEKLAGETSKLFPNGTIWNAVQLPEIRAAIELQHGQPAKAVELLASASPYERAYPEVMYLRGVAYLHLHKGAEAAAEFQKILDHKGASWGSTWRYPNWGLYYSISYVGLARGWALAGDTAKARKAFQDFFLLWKDADADVPLLADAQKEYARLP